MPYSGVLTTRKQSEHENVERCTAAVLVSATREQIEAATF